MIDLAKLNSATKYPSIPTYHAMGERGILRDEILVPLGDVDIIGTEKVNGTNGRIIMFPDGTYIIGSREELLYAKGDLIGNPQLGIVDALKPFAERTHFSCTQINVFYLEVYGGSIGKSAKQYTGRKEVSYRLFDVAFIPLHIMSLPIEQISAWRDAGGQTFVSEDTLDDVSHIHHIPLAPRIKIDHPPIGIADTLAWLKSRIPRTLSALDDGAGGGPEGLVVRTADRSKITKIRIDDYERTLRAGI